MNEPYLWIIPIITIIIIAGVTFMVWRIVVALNGSSSNRTDEYSYLKFNRVITLVKSIDLSGLHTLDPYFELNLNITNLSGERVEFTGISGRLKIDECECNAAATLETPTVSRHEETLTVRQAITTAMKEYILYNLDNPSGKVYFSLIHWYWSINSMGEDSKLSLSTNSFTLHGPSGNRKKLLISLAGY